MTSVSKPVRLKSSSFAPAASALDVSNPRVLTVLCLVVCRSDDRCQLPGTIEQVRQLVKDDEPAVRDFAQVPECGRPVTEVPVC